MNKFLLLAVFTLLTASNLFAQTRNEAGTPFITNYPPKEYGAHPQNWSIIQDQRGIIYFANSIGALEYDGVTWRLIPGPNRSLVRSFDIDANNRIYVGGNADFGYFKSDTSGQLQFVSFLNMIKEEDSQFGNVWHTFVTPDGVYFQGVHQLFRYVPPASGVVNSDEKLKAWKARGGFFYSAWINNKLYLYDVGVGILRLAGEKIELVKEGARFANLSVEAILPFDDEKILVASSQRGLFLYDGNSFQPFDSEVSEFITKNQLMAGAVSPNGNFAFATMRGGVILMNAKGKTVQILDKNAGLSDNFVRNVYFDRHGAMWLALDGGLARAETPSPLSIFDDKSGMESYVSAIIRHNGTLYVATGLGVYYLDSAKREFKLVSGISERCWWLLSVDNILLVATDGGVYGIDKDRGYVVRKSQEQSFYAYSLYRSKQNPNRVYVGLVDGLASLRLQGNRWLEEWRINGLNENVRNFAETEDGKLWMGTHSTGLLRIDISNAETGATPTIERFGEETKLPLGGVSVYSIQDKIIFAMRGQLLTFDEAGKTFSHDSTFELVSFGGSQEEYSFKEDYQGNIWMNFGRETAFITKNENGSFSAHKKPFLEISDLPNYFIFPDDDGIVWMGSEEMLVRYDPTIPKDYELDYPALIRKVVAGGDSIIYGGAEAKIENPVLDYADNSVRIEYTATSFEVVSENRYQTFLEGFDKDWSNWTEETRRDFTNLSEGDYVFRVRAKNIYQHPSSEASFAFSIAPPWFRTWWAYLLYVLTAGALIFGLISIRTKQLQAQQRELEKTVEDRTKEIQQRVEELAVINSVQDGLVRELDIQAIYNLVGDRIRDIFDAQVVLIATFDHSAGQENIHYNFEKGKQAPALTRPLDKARQALIKGKETILINQEFIEEIHNRFGVEKPKPIPGTKLPKSLVFVPLIVGETVKGYISLQNIDREHAFPESDVRLLTTLANSMSVALENARLFDETKQRAAEMATVNNISKALVAQLEFDRLVHLVGEQMRETFEADIVYVALLDENREMIDFPYEYGDELASIPFGEGLTSRIIKTGEPLLINRDLRNVHQEMGISTIGVPAASYLGVPIPAGNKNIGVISVQSTTEENRFDEDSLRLLGTIAANVGVAIQNAESYRKLNEALEHLKAAQQQLVTQEKLASLGQLTAGIAHEIKNPLNFVNNFAELSQELVEELREELKKNADKVDKNDAENIRAILDDLEQNSKKINEHGKRADSIVKGMLQHSRGTKGERQPTDINFMLEEDLNLAYHGMRAQDSGFNITMEKDFDENLGKIEIVPQDISRVFLNIFTNGLYAAHQNRSSRSKDFSPTIWVKTRGIDNKVEIKIRDNGSGIPEDIREKIFQPFFTTKPTGQGTGLGLSISYDIIVQEHNGEIRVDSKEGEFTEFVITLPR